MTSLQACKKNSKITIVIDIIPMPRLDICRPRTPSSAVVETPPPASCHATLPRTWRVLMPTTCISSYKLCLLQSQHSRSTLMHCKATKPCALDSIS
ncbi:hypothetical protein IQ06DRAFT_100214 [Phaeosphaeriaceae sp. SRC1lsM3a]|nr:hypothetical protein IQ06DRAFT_100214 [Stagonospora sp. SRC1lsM3a]